MSVITRGAVVDADTGEVAEAFSFKFGQPATKADIEALYEFLVSKSPPGMLETAKARLPEIEGFPEYVNAARAIERAEHFAGLKQWDRVSAEVGEFSACYERAMRRKEVRAEHQRKVLAGQKSGRRRNRDAEIIARHSSLTSTGADSAKATAICAKEFEVSTGQIRRIIKAQTK